ncbi:RNA editing 3 terminal uridylyl transferase 1, putative [Bodo saltans]|uniref:RNA uridylyltransferase n=1 Tax=Bodo saltans TaxID=75058 RepID=A0A0S4J6F2_BODSA|nr:RNA editing 3 terminal uridylyl transferase 1, putative [Bodo saltans]|eukprot:CUG84887.1 RNA editing 3 terminal uridylyl transferase 1, putative [Bodo saltans]
MDNLHHNDGAHTTNAMAQPHQGAQGGVQQSGGQGDDDDFLHSSSPTSSSSSSTRLYSCDACSNVCFGNAEQLEEHVRLRHIPVMLPQFEEMSNASSMVKDNWEALQTSESVSEKLTLWGEKAFGLALQRDAGLNKMQEAHAARAQLEVAVQRWLPSCSVYIFGSSVALGVWDGSSDVDFTVVDVNALERGAWNPNEKQAVRSIAQVLYRAGFSTQNLELIPFARVPIIKHHKNTPLIPPVALRAVGQWPDDVEKTVARSARFSLASPASPQDRLLMEASVRASLSHQDAAEQIWWDRRGTEMCVTFSTSTEAMRALTATPATTASNKCMRAAPLHMEFSPELFHVDFDLSFRVFGIRNSQLLRKYLLAHPCARPGSLVLKDWSKSSGVNNSQAGFLTSYAINMLWIYFLVQRGVVPYVDPLDIPASLASPEHSRDPQYSPMLSPELSEEQRRAQFSEMGRLLVDFFQFYANEFDWETHVVSLNRKSITTKAQLGWDEEDVQQGRKHTRYVMCIEDPYEENLNLGRHLGPTKSMKVLHELRKGLLSLLKDDLTSSSVFELCDDASKNVVMLPPGDALLKLVKHILIAFEEAAYQQQQQPTTTQEVEGAASSSPPPKRAAANGSATTFIKSDALHSHLHKQAPLELELALKFWSWQQLLHRLGYKCLGGVVYRRGTLLSSSPAAATDAQPSQASQPSSSSSTSSSLDDATARVRAALRQQLDTVQRDGATWGDLPLVEEAVTTPISDVSTPSPTTPTTMSATSSLSLTLASCHTQWRHDAVARCAASVALRCRTEETAATPSVAAKSSRRGVGPQRCSATSSSRHHQRMSFTAEMGSHAAATAAPPSHALGRSVASSAQNAIRRFFL